MPPAEAEQAPVAQRETRARRFRAKARKARIVIRGYANVMMGHNLIEP